MTLTYFEANAELVKEANEGRCVCMCVTLTYFEVKAEPSFVSLPISKIRHVVLYDVTSS